jgi:hypothetical protein
LSKKLRTKKKEKEQKEWSRSKEKKRKEKKKEEWIYPSSGRICKVQMKLKLPSTRNAVAAEIHCACIVVLQAGTHLPLLYRSVSLSRAQVPHGIVGDRRPCPEGG